MTSTITPEQEQAIRDFLADREIVAGLGTKDAACSVAAINLALTGELTADVPECMSPVVGRWIIRIQDAAPSEIRNSDEWRELLPLAAGTGRNHETERRGLVLDWMWTVVLPHLQPLADKWGFDGAWRRMTSEKSPHAAADAAVAVACLCSRDGAHGADAAASAYAAATAADATYAVAYALKAASAQSTASAYAAARTARAAAHAADAVADDADDADVAWLEAWRAFDPVGLLRKLIAVGRDDHASD